VVDILSNKGRKTFLEEDQGCLHLIMPFVLYIQYKEYAKLWYDSQKVTTRKEERNQPALMGTELQQP